MNIIFKFSYFVILLLLKFIATEKFRLENFAVK